MFSDVLELHYDTWDPTYGSGPPGIFRAVVCHECGSLVDAAATAKHEAFHARLS